MSISADSRYFALVPAAGSGARMEAGLPKQYLTLLDRPLIYHALAALCAVPEIERVYVVLSADDPWWRCYDWHSLGEKLMPLFCGGPTRAASVLGGLRAIGDEVAATDWMLVHDAARPCLTDWQIERLIGQLAQDDVGGLLAVPMADTLKRVDARQRIVDTVSRDSLWRAQTPQMFRYGVLTHALEQALYSKSVTDEASAIEALGLQPRVVEGDVGNLKVTFPFDLHLAEQILRHRQEDKES